jgi:hypothetical protein
MEPTSGNPNVGHPETTCLRSCSRLDATSLKRETEPQTGVNWGRGAVWV